MRDLRFKAQRMSTSKWIEFTLGDLVCKKVEEFPGEIWLNWRQHTGLKDKNGVEIYEGDVLAQPGTTSKWRAAVEWNPLDACFFTEGEDVFYWKKCEVIGNIYENPELLK